MSNLRRLLIKQSNNEDGDLFTAMFVVVILILIGSLLYVIYKMVNRQVPTNRMIAHNLLQDGERKEDRQMQSSGKQPQTSENGRDQLHKSQLETHTKDKNKTLITVEDVQNQIKSEEVNKNISIDGQVLHDEDDDFNKKSQSHIEEIESPDTIKQLKVVASEYSEHNLSNVFNLENEESQPRKRQMNGKKYEKVI